MRKIRVVSSCTYFYSLNEVKIKGYFSCCQEVTDNLWQETFRGGLQSLHDTPWISLNVFHPNISQGQSCFVSEIWWDQTILGCPCWVMNFTSWLKINFWNLLTKIQSQTLTFFVFGIYFLFHFSFPLCKFGGCNEKHEQGSEKAVICNS